MPSDQLHIEPMPDEVKQRLMDIGMDEEQALQCGELSQRIRDASIDLVSADEMISPADLAVAAMACKMASVWLEAAAVKIAEEEQEE